MIKVYEQQEKEIQEDDEHTVCFLLMCHHVSERVYKVDDNDD